MNLTEVTNLTALAVRASRIRGFVPFGLDETNLIKGVLNGTVVLDPAELDREVEAYIATVRCHERCKPTVRKMGYAIHKQFKIDPNLCEVCATPMVCKNPDDPHGTHMTPKLARAIARFRDEVYANAETIDPNQNHDWHDLAMGFMLACRVPPKELSWGLLSELSCGHFDKYLEPAKVWAQEYLRDHPECVTVRLGHGWDPSSKPNRGHIVWADAIDNEGHQYAASQDTSLPALPTLPDNVIKWVIHNVPLGEYRDHDRPLDP